MKIPMINAPELYVYRVDCRLIHYGQYITIAFVSSQGVIVCICDSLFIDRTCLWTTASRRISKVSHFTIYMSKRRFRMHVGVSHSDKPEEIRGRYYQKYHKICTPSTNCVVFLRKSLHFSRSAKPTLMN